MSCSLLRDAREEAEKEKKREQKRKKERRESTHTRERIRNACVREAGVRVCVRGRCGCVRVCCTRASCSGVVHTGRKRGAYGAEGVRKRARGKDGDGQREKERSEGDRETDRVYVPPEECTRPLVL